MTLQFGASLTDDTRSVNYDCNTFIIQATGVSNTATVLANDFVAILYGGRDGEGGKHDGARGIRLITQETELMRAYR